MKKSSKVHLCNETSKMTPRKKPTSRARSDLDLDPSKAPMGQPPIPDPASKTLSPYDDSVQGNPVGALQELYMSRQWPLPVYDLNHEEGLPHEKMFTIHCTIEV